MIDQTAAWDDRQIHSFHELALFLGGSEDSFTGLLLHLIAKARATPQNFARLELAFPVEVAAWRAWMSCDPAPTFKQLRGLLRVTGITNPDGVSFYCEHYSDLPHRCPLGCHDWRGPK